MTTGVARRVAPIIEVVAEGAGQLHLVAGGEAIWTSAGGRLRLEAFDGTVLREWDAPPDYRIPSSALDGRLLVVPQAEGWYVERGGVSTRVVGAARMVVPRADGRWLAYLAPSEKGDGWSDVRVRDLATSADRFVQRVRACNCGIVLRIGWGGDGRLYFSDYADPAGRDLGLAPGQHFTYDVDLARIEAAPTPAGTAGSMDAPSAYPWSGMDCRGLRVRHPAMAPAEFCIEGADIGAWSRDGSRLAYLLHGAVYVRRAGAIGGERVGVDYFGIGAALLRPAIQWDPSGRYVLFMTDWS